MVKSACGTSYFNYSWAHREPERACFLCSQHPSVKKCHWIAVSSARIWSGLSHSCSTRNQWARVRRKFCPAIFTTAYSTAIQTHKCLGWLVIELVHHCTAACSRMLGCAREPEASQLSSSGSCLSCYSTSGLLSVESTDSHKFRRFLSFDLVWDRWTSGWSIRVETAKMRSRTTVAASGDYSCCILHPWLYHHQHCFVKSSSLLWDSISCWGQWSPSCSWKQSCSSCLGWESWWGPLIGDSYS